MQGGEHNFVGRWDITARDANGMYASWLEISRQQEQYIGLLVWLYGSPLPVPHIVVSGDQLMFGLRFQGQDLVFRGRLVDRRLEGTTETANGIIMRWTGVPAPRLHVSAQVTWGNPVTLFNGRDLREWRLRNEVATDCWRVIEGSIMNQAPCVDLISQQTFVDFTLHIEFKTIKGNGSGVYLRGRYEVQIQDDFGKEPANYRVGSLYGFLTPTSNPSKPSGEWQTYDITLIGRQLTVVLNGTTIIDQQEIPGITGGALDSHEERPGPLMLQGDHGEIAFRNIVLTPASSPSSTLSPLRLHPLHAQ